MRLPFLELPGETTELCAAEGSLECDFLDAGGWKEDPSGRGQLAIDLLEPGGLLVKDDMTPGFSGPDPVRAWLFGHPELVASEILTTRDTAAIVAAKRG